MQTNNQTPKKVLYVITKSNWGGAQRYVYDLVTNLDRGQFEPVVAFGGDGTLGEMLHNAGIRTISLEAMQNKAGLGSAWHSGRELYQVIRSERPAVVHLNSSVAGLIGGLTARLCFIPRIIFTAHGWAFNEDRPWWQRLIFKGFHWLTVLLSHHTIAVSRAIVAEMNWPFAQKKMAVINPGRTIGVMFEHDEAREKIVDFFPQVALYRNDPWLVCVAELHPIKRHLVLFEAVRNLTAQFPTIRLLCFGDGQLRSELEMWVKDHQMTEHIFVLGNLHEAARFLKAFDMFVLASKSESYGYVIHEAGLAGVPIVATDVGGIRDIIDHQVTGTLVQLHQSASLQAAITDYLCDPNKAQEHALTLQKTLFGRSVPHMVKQIISYYNS
jgi:glycosyltransferase involved in cell wall biosynthesis